MGKARLKVKLSAVFEKCNCNAMSLRQRSIFIDLNVNGAT